MDNIGLAQRGQAWPYLGLQRLRKEGRVGVRTSRKQVGAERAASGGSQLTPLLDT